MVKRVFGTAGFSYENDYQINNLDEAKKALDLLRKNGVDHLDTARIYGNGTTEKILGELEAHKSFTIDTKAPGMQQGSLTKDGITKFMDTSLEALRTKKVHIYYLHAPDRGTPFEEQCEAVDKLYTRGSFELFGLSNFTADEVQQMYDICKKNNYVLPTVYQGNYNAVTRTNETELFPLLKKLNIAFYAYSPVAGGLLLKTVEQLKNPAKGSRFDTSHRVGQMYSGMYISEPFFEALGSFEKVCKKHHIKQSNAAFRWLLHHSQLKGEDAFILGASSVKQLEENLADSTGNPLPDDVVKEMEAMWDTVKSSAPKYHF